MENKVFGYIRVSTLTQAEKGYGLKMQQQAIEKYCKDNNLELINIYSDEGVSGAKTSIDEDKVDRIGLTDLLSNIKGHNVVVLNTSRLWRSDTVKVLIQRELKRLKSDIISIEQPTYSIYTKNANDFLINGMMELLDQYERMSIALKLSKGRRTKARAGIKACGVAPFGYKWDRSTSTVIIDEEKAAIVKEIFSLALKNKPLQKIADEVNLKGLTNTKGNKFSKQSISVILKNKFYTGVIVHGDIEMVGTHEALVSKVIFGKVQFALKKRKK